MLISNDQLIKWITVDTNATSFLDGFKLLIEYQLQYVIFHNVVIYVYMHYSCCTCNFVLFDIIN